MVGILLLVLAVSCQKEQQTLINDSTLTATSNPQLKSGTINLPVNFGNIATIAFLGMELTAEGNSTFTYNVVSGQKPALSHWGLNILPALPGAGVDQVVILECTELYVQGKDGSLKKFDATLSLKEWVKFDRGYADNESRLVSFTLEGKWDQGPVSALVKGGNTYVSFDLTGPVQTKLPR